MSGRRPTIKDVAAHAGVSKSTVSLVLQESELVAPETRKLVHASMRELNYVKNRAAATLRGSGTGLIGLVINDLRNPFFTEFAASAQMALQEHGFSTVIANCDEDPVVQETTIRSILEHDVAGLIISPCYGEVAAAFQSIENSGVPALQVLRRVSNGKRQFPFFTHDYVLGSKLAVSHLLDQGLERIAFVGGLEGRDITADRMSGYVEEMKSHGLKAKVIHGRPTRSFGRKVAQVVLEEYPEIDAAICFNDLVALGMQAGLAAIGRVTGEDFFLVGFDDIEEARLAYPSLTTIRCDVRKFGKESAQLLMAQMSATEPIPQFAKLEVELVIRESSISR